MLVLLHMSFVSSPNIYDGFAATSDDKTTLNDKNALSIERTSLNDTIIALVVNSLNC